MIQIYRNIPEELKQLKQWCGYRILNRNGRNTKVPINPYTGEFGKSNDESTWSDFETAVEAINKFNLNGIGFYFKEPYIGIDIDDVRGQIEAYLSGNTDDENNIVAEFIDIMQSYAEISPSGNGVHIIVKGDLPKNGSRKGNIEMYSNGRFFTMTGNHIGGYIHINDDRDYGRLKYLHNKYIASHDPIKPKNTPNTPGNNLPVDEIINIALKSKNGLRFRLFLEGGWEQFYQSQSEADMAFANDLAFWTNRDYEKMDTIFRQSSLYREKWDEKRGETTYGHMTLSKAISECMNVFNPETNNHGIKVLEFETKKVEQKFYSYDDTGNAARFTDMFGDVVRYSYVRKNWFYYDGKVWRLDQEGKVKSLVDKVLEKMKKEPVFVADDIDEEQAQKALQKHIKYSRGSNGKTNMLKESQHLVPINTDDFDKDKHLLNVQNGYLDLNTGKLHEHDKSKFFTKIANVEYTDKIDCPMWEEFLHDIFDGNRPLINYIQRAVGYSLSGSTEEQMMFILYGNGRNGKSVFLDIITEMLGNYTTNIQPQTLMVKPMSGSANSDIARLQGARLVTTTEPNDGMRFDEGLVKQVTGGDKVTARFLYGDEFEYHPEFKLWMATNHKPIIRGTDDGIWRRMAIIPFTVQIPEHKVDKNLKYKLRREMKGILNWAVQGYQEWKRIGLNEPDIIKQQRGDYRKEMDPVEQFIEECCYRKDGEREKASDLYRVYRSWAQENQQYLMSNTKFGREMSNKFQKITSNGVHYVGIQLKREFNNEAIRLTL